MIDQKKIIRDFLRNPGYFYRNEDGKYSEYEITSDDILTLNKIETLKYSIHHDILFDIGGATYNQLVSAKFSRDKISIGKFTNLATGETTIQEINISLSSDEFHQLVFSQLLTETGHGKKMTGETIDYPHQYSGFLRHGKKMTGETIDYVTKKLNHMMDFGDFPQILKTETSDGMLYIFQSVPIRIIRKKILPKNKKGFYQNGYNYQYEIRLEKSFFPINDRIESDGGWLQIPQSLFSLIHFGRSLAGKKFPNRTFIQAKTARWLVVYAIASKNNFLQIPGKNRDGIFFTQEQARNFAWKRASSEFLLTVQDTDIFLNEIQDYLGMDFGITPMAGKRLDGGFQVYLSSPKPEKG